MNWEGYEPLRNDNSKLEKQLDKIKNPKKLVYIISKNEIRSALLTEKETNSLQKMQPVYRVIPPKKKAKVNKEKTERKIIPLVNAEDMEKGKRLYPDNLLCEVFGYYDEFVFKEFGKAYREGTLLPEIKDDFDDTVKSINEKYRNILYLRFEKSFTYKQCGQCILNKAHEGEGILGSSAQVITNRALRKIRSSKTSSFKALHRAVDEYSEVRCKHEEELKKNEHDNQNECDDFDKFSFKDYGEDDYDKDEDYEECDEFNFEDYEECEKEYNKCYEEYSEYEDDIYEQKKALLECGLYQMNVPNDGMIFVNTTDSQHKNLEDFLYNNCSEHYQLEKEVDFPETMDCILIDNSLDYDIICNFLTKENIKAYDDKSSCIEGQKDFEKLNFDRE